MGSLTGRRLGTLIVDAIPGGFTVTEAGSEKHWWSVAFRGSTATIASHLCEAVDPRSVVGRQIVAAVRESLVSAR